MTNTLNDSRKNVLVVAPSRITRGGITAVVKSYESTPIWNDWNCFWVETHVDKSFLHKLYYFIKSLIVYLSKVSKYDIVHIHVSEPASAIRKTFYFLPAIVFKKKIIVHFHAFSPLTTVESRFSFLYRFLFSRASVVIVLSNSWKQSILKVFPNLNNVKIIYNPADSSNRYLRSEINDKEHYILFAGTLNERKGYSDLIQAFAVVVKKFPNYKLYLAGNGEMDKANSLVDKYGLHSNVKFLGWINGDFKNKVFANASIFCLPSYAEGFPMAVLDAFSYGIPVVTTPVGGMPDLLSDNESVLFVEPGNVSNIADALTTLIEQPALQHKLIRNANTILTENFSLISISKQIDKLYYELA